MKNTNSLPVVIPDPTIVDATLEDIQQKKAGLTIKHVPTVRPTVLTYTQDGTSGRGNLVQPEYDLNELAVIEDVEGIVHQAFKKKISLMFKEGFSLVGPNKIILQYLKTRMAQIARASNIGTQDLLRRIGYSLIRTSNAFLIKVRKEEASGGKKWKDASGKERIPIAAYFPAAPETMSAIFNNSVNNQGALVGWRQTLPSGVYRDFPVDDVIHFTLDRREGFLFGTPVLVPIVDDIRSLRKIEENIELLIYQHLFPLYHYKVGTETAPAGFTENGEREVDAVKNELKYMPAEGCLVTPERHEINAVGAEGRALRAESYIQHFLQRVVAGLGISMLDLGNGDTSNRATSTVLSRALIDSVKDIQDNLESQFDNFIISELLLESSFVEDVLAQENMVHLRFEEIDVDNKIKQEEHAKDLFKLNGLTYSEFRQSLAKEPINLPEDGEDQDLSKYPEWRETYWKLIEEPTALIKNTSKQVGDSSAFAAAAAPSTALTSKEVEKGQSEMRAIEKEKNKKPPVKTKDAFLSQTYAELKHDILEEYKSGEDTKFVDLLLNIWLKATVEKTLPLLNSYFLTGFSEQVGQYNSDFLSSVQLGRKIIRERLETFLNKFIISLKQQLETQTNQSLIFDVLEHRLEKLLINESKKAYNYGICLGNKIISRKKNLQINVICAPQEGSCPVCKTKADNVQVLEWSTIDDIPPHHPHCVCGIKVTIEANK